MKFFRPYQVEGAARLAAAERLYLGDEPGLGKTRTALLAAVMAGAQRIAVACPAIVRPQWAAEAALVAPGLDLHVASYSHLVVSPDARAAWRRIAPDTIILDEAHFLKNRESKRTQVLLASDTGLVMDVPHVWPLSGTPMPRHPGELFAILYALWRPQLAAIGLKGYMEFLNRFAVYRATQHGIRVYKAKNVPQLKLLLAPILLRRRVRDVAPELPSLRFGVLPLSVDDLAKLDLSELPLETVQAIERGELPPMDPHIARVRHQIGNLKAPAVAELVQDELEHTDEKRVIFYHHRSVGDVLLAKLHRYGVARIDGETPEAQRTVNRLAFADATHVRVLLAQIETCAVGMDGIQKACHEAIMVEPAWDSMYNEQAGRRLARLGQTLPVDVRMIALAGTLDDAIVRNHHREVTMRLEVVG